MRPPSQGIIIVDKVPPSMPIEETRKVLNLTVSLPTHVRTAHDLLVAIDRKEVEGISAAQAKAIRERIG